MRNRLAFAAACAAALLFGQANPSPAQSLDGSGSSFVGPLMSKWARDYAKAKEVKVNYTLVGSGAGIRQFLARETDFGCTDAFLTADEMKKAAAAGMEVVHVPLALGGVVVAYNLPGVKDALRLNGAVLAEIFQGKIKKWNDDAIKEINPSIDLPDRDIVVLYRSDKSGSTAIFTDYLAKVSPDWKKTIGQGTSVQWPAGQGHKGNEELAAAIARTPGAIGYVELLHALKKKIKAAAIKNRDGNYVTPSLEGVTAAAENVLKEIPGDLRFSLTNSAGKDSYPLSGATWALVCTKQKGERGQRLVSFLTWVTHDGQEAATDLYYSRLPAGLVKKVEAQLARIQVEK
jgi:phosphate transport system substrate-binding protein